MNRSIYIITFSALFIIFICLFLIGCSSVSKEPVIYVPTKCAKFSIPGVPELPIKKLTPNSSNSEVVKSYVISLHMLNDYINQQLYPRIDTIRRT